MEIVPCYGLWKYYNGILICNCPSFVYLRKIKVKDIIGQIQLIAMVVAECMITDHSVMSEKKISKKKVKEL